MILLVPSLKKGCGSGHLKRMIRLHHQLPQSSIYLKNNDNPVYFPLFDDCRATVSVGEVPLDTKMVVFDNFRTHSRQLKDFPEDVIRIGIDEGGAARPQFDYLLDIFPTVKSQQQPNFSSLAFLHQDNFKKRTRKTISSLLISFGGEDSAGLTQKVVDFLLAHQWEKKYKITVLSPHIKSENYPQLEVVSRIRDLSQQITQWDLVMTHFGLTAFEALFQNVPVILINPTTYHHKLTQKIGLPEAGVEMVNETLLNGYLAEPQMLSSVPQPFQKKDSTSLSDFFIKRETSGSPLCPICGKRGRVHLRQEQRTIYHCHRCHLHYQLLWKVPEVRYKKNYFFQEYQAAYGRTYLEDFDSIKSQGLRRLGIIQSLSSTQKELTPRLLDVGCAYGPFMQAAAEKGWDVWGCELCNEAANYVKKNLKLSVHQCAFEDFPEEGLKYDVISLWYVIEHFENLHLIMEKINRLLASNGILAFSTPNGGGWSRIKSLKNFLTASPEDHFTILTPWGVKKMLRRYGFKVKKIKITGIHPERIWDHCDVSQVKPWLYRFLCRLFQILGWGDTFEVYAEKK